MRIQTSNEQNPKVKITSHVKLSKWGFVVEWVALLLGIQETLGSNPGPQTDYPEEFKGASRQTSAL
jgi:hypothetical protein